MTCKSPPWLPATINRPPALKLFCTQSSLGEMGKAAPWTLKIISYWSADKLSSIYYLSLDLRKLYLTNSAQKLGDVCLSRPPVPTSHVLEYPRVLASHDPGSPRLRVPTSPSLRVPESHVPRPTSQSPRPTSQSPSPRPTFSDSRLIHSFGDMSADRFTQRLAQSFSRKVHS